VSKLGELIDTGDFQAMLDLASECANDEGGIVVVHRKYCDDPQADNCPCQPFVVGPYSKVQETETDGPIQ
jgi:hypothetical protein